MSIEKNNFKNITLLQKAFSDEIGKASFIVPNGHGMNASLLDNSHAPYGSTTIEVETTTLDSFNTKFDFIKIDAEGGERKIWDGAQKYLEKYPETLILLEWRYDRYDDPEKFAEEIFKKCIITYVDFEGMENPVQSPEQLYTVKNADWMLVLRVKNEKGLL